MLKFPRNKRSAKVQRIWGRIQAPRAQAQTPNSRVCSARLAGCGVGGRGMKAGWRMEPLATVCQIKPPKAEARSKISANELVSFVPMESLGIDQKVLVPTQTRPLSEVAGSYTSIPIRLPTSITTRQQIVSNIELLLEEVSRLEAIYEQKITALDDLKISAAPSFQRCPLKAGLHSTCNTMNP